MNGLIRFSLGNWYAVVVLVLSVGVLGAITVCSIPVDILPTFKSPAVQVLTFYGGMPAANVENDISNRMERWTGQSAGQYRQESRSIVGCSIVRNYYTEDIDPNGALTQVNSLASAAIPNLPPGTLPPVILPFDPTSTTPVCLVALDSENETESILYDAGRYEVRNYIMGVKGAVAPVVYGGKIRAVLAYMDRDKMQARNLAPADLMDAIDRFNVFLPTGDAKFGDKDFALDSNSMYELVKRMGDIPVKTEPDGKVVFLRDVADPEDASLVQTNIVRVNGRKQVYIPVYRQGGASTLRVVSELKNKLPEMKGKLTHDDIDLKPVMDQSIYVFNSITSLAFEGVLGAILCSLVILLFLGEWRMTVIAVLTIPVAVLAAVIGLHATGNTINVMTLAGLALAVGPLVDSAIICLENTHRHLGLGARPKQAAFLGASEVAMPELVASCCTLLVLAPLAFMPGMGTFLFRPMALAVAFAMGAAYFLSRTFVPSMCMLFLRPHPKQPGDIAGPDREHRREHEHAGARGPLARAFAAWESLINVGIGWYVLLLGWAMKRRGLVLAAAVGLFIAVVLGLGSQLRREFFPEVDAGAFEIYVRAPSGTRIEETNERIARVEKFLGGRLGEDKDTVISEIGVVADWSAAYTPNSGPMDAVVKVQLKGERHRSAQEYVELLREGFQDPTKFGDPDFTDPNEFKDLEFAFDAGGMIRSAMNEGKSTPLNVRITGKEQKKAHKLAAAIRDEVTKIDGVVDCRILQRLDYPEFVVNVDRAKAAALGLSQTDVMKNLVAALNSSISYNKRNFWIDPKNHNQYYVGVQYPEQTIESADTLLDVPITSPTQKKPIPLRNVAAELKPVKVAAEITHTDLQPTIDLTMGVQGRDLGHVADEVYAVLGRFGEAEKDKWLGGLWETDKRGVWQPFDPDTLSSEDKQPLVGSKIVLSGEYSRMQDTFTNLGFGLILAALLIYFLMVALFKSWMTPLVILSAVPLGLVGVVTMLYLTGTALNVQSLLGVIFMVGIVVSNTVLLTDFAQNLRRNEGLTPTQAITRAAAVRVRPVVMTALAAFFALLPMSLGLERGSEANVPLGRAVVGGLLAGLVTTLIVVPALFSLVVRGSLKKEDASGELPAAPADGVAPAAAFPVSNNSHVAPEGIGEASGGR
jgi:multidrug efflux pump subunit AcrB